MIACPLPRWLQQWSPDRSVNNHGYSVPSAQEILEVSAAVQIWEKKWPADLLQAVLSFALDVRRVRRTDPMSDRVLMGKTFAFQHLLAETEGLLVGFLPQLAVLTNDRLEAGVMLVTALEGCRQLEPEQLWNTDAEAFHNPCFVAAALLLMSTSLHKRPVEDAPAVATCASQLTTLVMELVAGTTMRKNPLFRALVFRCIPAISLKKLRHLWAEADSSSGNAELEDPTSAATALCGDSCGLNDAVERGMQQICDIMFFVYDSV